jgi:hypothetical protein
MGTNRGLEIAINRSERSVLGMLILAFSCSGFLGRIGSERTVNVHPGMRSC